MSSNGSAQSLTATAVRVAQAGDRVNLETDIIGKHVLRLFTLRTEAAAKVERS